MAIQNASNAQLVSLRTRVDEFRLKLHQLMQKRQVATGIDAEELTELSTALSNCKAAVDAVAAA